MPSAISLNDLAQRLQALEDIHAITQLKARYLRACDRKLPGVMRDCFVPQGAVIEADGFPAFSEREAWVQVFTEFAVNNPAVLDMHHGHNPQITLTGADTAEGTWDLEFRQINVQTRVVTEITGEYHERYVRKNGRWWIQTLRFHRATLRVSEVGADGIARVLELGAGHAGKSMEALLSGAAVAAS